MDCPECGGPLDAYVLGGREAVTCARCGWVGIEADHRGAGVRDESWDEALGRFYERQVETERRRADLPRLAASVGRSAADPSPDGESLPDDEGRRDDPPAEGTSEDVPGVPPTAREEVGGETDGDGVAGEDGAQDRPTADDGTPARNARDDG